MDSPPKLQVKQKKTFRHAIGYPFVIGIFVLMKNHQKTTKTRTIYSDLKQLTIKKESHEVGQKKCSISWLFLINTVGFNGRRNRA